MVWFSKGFSVRFAMWLAWLLMETWKSRFLTAGRCIVPSRSTDQQMTEVSALEELPKQERPLPITSSPPMEITYSRFSEQIKKDTSRFPSPSLLPYGRHMQDVIIHLQRPHTLYAGQSHPVSIELSKYLLLLQLARRTSYRRITSSAKRQVLHATSFLSSSLCRSGSLRLALALLQQPHSPPPPPHFVASAADLLQDGMPPREISCVGHSHTLHVFAGRWTEKCTSCFFFSSLWPVSKAVRRS